MSAPEQGTPVLSTAGALSSFLLDKVKAATRGTSSLLQRLSGGRRSEQLPPLPQPPPPAPAPPSAPATVPESDQEHLDKAIVQS